MPLGAQEPVQEPAQEPATAAPEPVENAGPLVTAIEIRSDAPLPEEQDFAGLIEAEVGEPLTEERIRHTLRNLQASGTASETELYTRDDPERGGVVVMIVFRAVVQVAEVRDHRQAGAAPADSLRRVITQAQAAAALRGAGGAGRLRAQGAL